MGLSPQYLICIDIAAADPVTLVADLQTLDPNATLRYRIEQRGVRTSREM